VKNRIYTSLLFGICAAFSVAGHAQTKPATKHATAKPTATHSKNTKPVNKKSPATAVKAKANDKKTPAVTKTADKKTSIAKVKQAAQKKSAAAPKSAPKKQAIVPGPIKNKKTAVATSKSVIKKQAIVAAKLKNNKQPIASTKPGRKIHSIASSEPNGRKHTVISSKSIKSVSVMPLHQKKQQNHRELDLDDAEPDQLTHTDDDQQSSPSLLDHPQNTAINTAHVSIETSLFLDGLEAGLSKELVYQLTEVFAWDIDFATNLRPGDQFTIVYGKKTVDGKETDDDEILAAEFINQGSSHTAVRYINGSDASYYTPDGESMQRAFLTTPVDFIKISSPFDTHRKHPILNRIRAHKGVDYAARTGTPVKTTGDGTVTFCGRNGAYGQVVIIQHNDHYETLYAHMSNFKKGLAVNDHVKQGDVIGYVGQTGLATGPHLHYEFHVDGIYRDPETVKIPHSMPISNSLLADFKAQTQPYYAQLVQAKAKSLLAKNPSHYD
jgi:murein DD-endopeptidase MepM/ murein hydrolase activator NlpD